MGDIFALGISIYEIARQKSLPNSNMEWHEIRDGNIGEEILLAPYIDDISNDNDSGRNTYNDSEITSNASTGFGFSKDFVNQLKLMMNIMYEERPTAQTVHKQSNLLLNRYERKKLLQRNISYSETKGPTTTGTLARESEQNKDQVIEEQRSRIKELEATILALDL